MKLIGQCTGGLSCDGGCCRLTVCNYGKVVESTYCQHYDQNTGNCKVYNQREQMGFSGCVFFPRLEDAMRNGLPKNCGFKLVNDDNTPV